LPAGVPVLGAIAATPERVSVMTPSIASPPVAAAWPEPVTGAAVPLSAPTVLSSAHNCPLLAAPYALAPAPPQPAAAARPAAATPSRPVDSRPVEDHAPLAGAGP
jgi:hypothetical protein